MTPEQIDAKIKQYGMTREEAEAKAKAVGIDLESCLTGMSQAVPASPQINSSIPVQQAATAVDTTGLLSPKAEVGAPGTGWPALGVVNPANPPALSAEDAQIFGLSVFRTAAPAFEASPSIADKDYIIGAGDVLKLSLWGQIQTMTQATVDRDGRITVDPVGSILVAGYSIEAARKRVTWIRSSNPVSAAWSARIVPGSPTALDILPQDSHNPWIKLWGRVSLSVCACSYLLWGHLLPPVHRLAHPAASLKMREAGRVLFRHFLEF